jgi:hypothetical protein
VLGGGGLGWRCLLSIVGLVYSAQQRTADSSVSSDKCASDGIPFCGHLLM